MYDGNPLGCIQMYDIIWFYSHMEVLNGQLDVIQFQSKTQKEVLCACTPTLLNSVFIVRWCWLENVTVLQWRRKWIKV